jgi:hypothetical protein
MDILALSQTRGESRKMLVHESNSPQLEIHTIRYKVAGQLHRDPVVQEALEGLRRSACDDADAGQQL